MLCKVDNENFLKRAVNWRILNRLLFVDEVIVVSFLSYHFH